MKITELQKGDMVYAQGRLTLDGPATEHVFFRVEKVLGSSVFTRLRNRIVELDADKLAGSLVLRGERSHHLAP